MGSVRLQVFLSRSGACSRRQALVIVFAGRVSVNGRRVTEPSFAVSPEKDRVFLDGRPLPAQGERGPAAKDYVILHKPKGVVTTKSDRFAARTVLDLLPDELRHINPAGRLDKDTTGLLFLSNDGDLVHRLTHPSFDVEKVYRARLDKPLAAADKKTLEAGIVLDGRRTRPCSLRAEGLEVEVTLHEGRKRQIRRMFALCGYAVKELHRLRHGPLTLGALAPGAWRRLTGVEVAALKDYAAQPLPRAKR
ncbi:MAG: pseudouridine synthase [Deltaproteobacteria bacterium]